MSDDCNIAETEIFLACRSNIDSTCKDCSKLFKDCACPWTETIKDHLLRTSGTEDQEKTMRWSDRALGREVIEERIEYHLQRRDIQTAATILCIVDPPKPKTATKRPERTNSRTRSSFPPPVTRRVRSSNSESDTSATLRQHYLDAAGRDGAVEATETSASVVDSAAAAVAIPSNARGSSLRKPRNISLNMSFSEMSFGGLSKLQRCHSESTAPPGGSSNVNNAAATSGSGVSVNSGNVSSSYGAAHSASTFSSATPLVSFPSVEHAEAAPPVATEDFLADPAKSQRNEAVKRWYSQFLRRLGMDIKSVEVAKFLKSNPDEQEFRIGLRDPCCESCSADPVVNPVNPVSWSDIAQGNLVTNCADCSATSRARARRRRWRHCAVCRLPVRGGLFSLCLHCGHGGHVAHLRDWFESAAEGGRRNAACPAGCGCPCEEMRMNPNLAEEQASA